MFLYDITVVLLYLKKIDPEQKSRRADEIDIFRDVSSSIVFYLLLIGATRSAEQQKERKTRPIDLRMVRIHVFLTFWCSTMTNGPFRSPLCFVVTTMEDSHFAAAATAGGTHSVHGTTCIYGRTGGSASGGLQHECACGHADTVGRGFRTSGSGMACTRPLEPDGYAFLRQRKPAIPTCSWTLPFQLKSVGMECSAVLCWGGGVAWDDRVFDPLRWRGLEWNAQRFFAGEEAWLGMTECSIRYVGGRQTTCASSSSCPRWVLGPGTQ
jgi:hypothetical protein